MDDLDLHPSEFVTDNDDLDSLDDQIELEQRRCNNQLWSSFQNAACCIAQLYKDRHQNTSTWAPFQNAASNLTTLYKDCIESQKRFARMGYQVGRRRRTKEMASWLKKQKFHASKHQHQQHQQHQQHHIPSDNNVSDSEPASAILAVNQLNLGCDSPPPVLLGNGDDDMQTFREALSITRGLNRGPGHKRSGTSNSNSSNQNRAIDDRSNNTTNIKSEEELIELNQFIAEEYHRHVDSRKRTCTSSDGPALKRHRD